MPNNPETYRAMSEPFLTPEEANAALQAFIEDVRAARLKHHIADVTLVAQSNLLYADGNEARALSHVHIGAVQESEGMLARALGEAQAERREAINKLLAGPHSPKKR